MLAYVNLGKVFILGKIVRSNNYRSERNEINKFSINDTRLRKYASAIRPICYHCIIRKGKLCIALLLIRKLQ